MVDGSNKDSLSSSVDMSIVGLNVLPSFGFCSPAVVACLSEIIMCVTRVGALPSVGV